MASGDLVGQTSSKKSRSATRRAIYAPAPRYKQGWAEGDGVAMLHIDPKSGNVLHVEMAKSTGNTVLDKSCTDAFSRWRFEPGTAPLVSIPITFSHHLYFENGRLEYR